MSPALICSSMVESAGPDSLGYPILLSAEAAGTLAQDTEDPVPCGKLFCISAFFFFLCC
jgi:hypothetical protein